MLSSTRRLGRGVQQRIGFALEEATIAHIFISYDSASRSRVMPLVNALVEEGWSVWWDRTIPPGKTFDDVIEKALDAAGCVITVWTETSVRNRWVKTEADEGNRRNMLVPVLLDDVAPPLAFRLIQAADLTDWVPGTPSVGFRNLLDAVSELLPLEGAEQSVASNDGYGLPALTDRDAAEQHDPAPGVSTKRSASRGSTPRRFRLADVSLWWVALAAVILVLSVVFVAAQLDGSLPTAQNGATSTTVASGPSTTIAGGASTTVAAVDGPSTTLPAEPLYLEAEHGTIGEPMAIQADTDASGNFYVSSPEAGDESNDLGGILALEFEIEHAGRYTIWGRIAVDEDRPTGSDSVFVRINEGPEDIWDFLEEDLTLGWAWEPISLRCGGDFETHRCNPWLVDLEPGINLLTLRNRDPGSKLDALWIVAEGSPELPPETS